MRINDIYWKSRCFYITPIITTKSTFWNVQQMRYGGLKTLLHRMVFFLTCSEFKIQKNLAWWELIVMFFEITRLSLNHHTSCVKNALFYIDDWNVNSDSQIYLADYQSSNQQYLECYELISRSKISNPRMLNWHFIRNALLILFV